MDDRATSLGLAGMLLAATVAAAHAADRLPSIEFGFDGSLPLSYSDNRFRNPAGRVDYLTSPFLRLSARGEIAPSLTYSLYASGGFDKYPVRAAADNTLATLGVSFAKRWDHFRVSVSYERNHAYDGVFGPFLYVSNDVGASASFLYTNALRTIRLRPVLSFSRRFADDLSADSYVVSFRIDFERKLAERWWFTLTPRVRHQNFLAGDNVGREDAVYSISTGLRYSINDQVGISGSVGYDRRTSNVANRNFDSFGAGISLDFSHTFGTRDR